MEDSREIQFSPVFCTTDADCFLMELPDAVMTALEEHREVVLKGQSEDDAVLCTDTQSFLVRSHETSNAMLVIDDYTVVMNAQQVFVPEKITPPLHQLHHLLTEAPFTWAESSPSPLYTMNDLLRLVQASKAETRAELRALHAFEWNGYWRVMEDQERIETIKHVLSLMMQRNQGTIRVSDVLSHLQVLERVPLVACLESAGEIEDDVWTPDQLQLYRICAIDLLLSKKDYFEDEFRTAFLHLSDIMIPARVAVPDLRLEDILRGVAIRKIVKGRSIFKYFPTEGLVKDFSNRLEQLFAVKDKWSLPEMRPYVEDISEKELQQQLMRFARRVVEDGVPYYLKKA